MQRTYDAGVATPQNSRRAMLAEIEQRNALEREHAAIAVEAIILKQEHGRERWWEDHPASRDCGACYRASLRLGYRV